ncbi:unnamed protein product [Rotaria sordida]|uniref:glutathione transferase n=1 Tax=Rotaria sordida TaxID=392033 RepID=A0A819CTN9_9BILA|nr:unnamed protein product [Rotaria sordida]CAF1016463.1 unnamed protein product [Rotaria sordida]CAF1310214.1 unnamed protein product [Rotaria sordida]CAF3648499.1 unnamed protein product [Rotaria sordida]CAF3719812.1 unnamed protein product [Rotaria sordida]
MSAYRLNYFNGRGRAEVSRLIFAAVGQKFEDIRYEQNEWPLYKNQMPLGQMPVLEFEGVKLPQSLAIARFLAKQFQLAGRDNFEQAKVDAVVDTINEVASKFAAVSQEKDEGKKQDGMRKLFTEDIPKNFQNLELLGKLYGNRGPFFVGNHLTWADLYFYDAAEKFLQIDGNVLKRYSWLQQNRYEVERQPKISAYLNSRPQTLF